MSKNGESSEEKMKRLVTKRGQLKGQITRFITFVDKFDGSKSLSELECRLEKNEILWNDFNDVQSQIESIDDSDEQNEYREMFENTFFEVNSRAKDMILSRKASVNNVPLNNDILSNNSNFVNAPCNYPTFVKLPSISLPKFDGHYDKWLSFKDSFEALVDRNANISNVQKFLYLQLSLTGVATKVISELEATEANYDIAWKLLEDRFENKKVICHAHVKALFELQSLGKESLQDLQKLVDDFNKHVRALKNLGEPTDHWSTLLMYLVYSKLDRNCQKDWNKESSKLEHVSIKDLMQFLSNRCFFLETLETNNKPSSFKNSFSHSNERFRDKTLSHVSQSITCYYCKGPHYIYSCDNFQRLPLKSRYDEIKKIGLCTNCLRQGHSFSTCRSSGCKKCRGKHNSLLHFDDETIKRFTRHNQLTNTCDSQVSENNVNKNALNAKLNVTASSNNETEPDSKNLVLMMHNKTHVSSPMNTHVLLSTAIINILDCLGRPIQARAILDSGSMSSFMSRNLLQKLGLPEQNINTTILGLNESSSITNVRTTATVQSKFTNFKKQISFLVVNEVTKNVPLVSFNTTDLNIPESIALADPKFNVPDVVDILIGAEIYYDLLCIGQIKLGINKPILQKSKFGWLVSGPIAVHKFNKNISHSNVSINQVIQNKLEDFWRIEEVNVPKINNKHDLECERIFTETVTTCKQSGHFIVTLPTVDPIPKLGDSREAAISRFLSLERKLKKNPELQRQYHDFMREYESLGHMTQINDAHDVPDNGELIYYLPHHGVVRENSITTKLRVVFNGSFETSNGISLNDILMVGPQLQEDLFSIITRFRKHTYALIADIEKMYRMVQVTESQRNLQRIIWRYDPTKPINHYCLNTLTYGTGPASFLAIRCLQQCALENKSKFPKASCTILNDFYVDDLITGSNSIESAIQLKQDVSEILSNYGFNLRKWASNAPQILVNNFDVNNDSQYLITDDTNHKTLGLQWQSNTDTLKFIINSNDENNQRVTIKAYLCIFVCFSSKAVHFELVGDLTSDSFLNCFKRFVARRGLCTDVFSDNGTNFLGAHNELNQVYTLLSNLSENSKFINYLHERHIKWHFAPARSPHFGGLCEAAVKSAKFHLKRILGNASLTFEELYTVVVQAESVLNSRPLIPLSQEPNDLLALTPGHLLIGDSLTAVPQAELVEVPLNRLSQYQRLQQMLQHFWQRWKHEYLNTLQSRGKWKFKCSNAQLQPGALVLMKDENTPPLKWPLGRVTDVYPGEDKLIRVVKVKTAGGIFKRSIVKVCPLPMNDC